MPCLKTCPCEARSSEASTCSRAAFEESWEEQLLSWACERDEAQAIKRLIAQAVFADKSWD